MCFLSMFTRGWLRWLISIFDELHKERNVFFQCIQVGVHVKKPLILALLSPGSLPRSCHLAEKSAFSLPLVE